MVGTHVRRMNDPRQALMVSAQLREVPGGRERCVVPRGYVRRNALTDSGTNTSSRPPSQASAPSVGASAWACPIMSALEALTVRLTGLTSANECTIPGIELVGTNAEDANTSGKTQMNPTD